jgi:pyruvate dehydrogenase E2 component (dihydrolipoamide acetyltransferase)
VYLGGGGVYAWYKLNEQARAGEAPVEPVEPAPAPAPTPAPVAAAVEPSPAQLSAAQDKVAEAEAAVAKVAASADAGAKEELSRVESSLTAAKNIVSEAIAKAEAEAAEVV